MKYFFWLPLLLGLLITTALRKSPVYDEVIYAPSGVFYWKTHDLRWNKEHPPLQKYLSAIPLLTQSLIDTQGLNPEKIDAWRAGYILFFGSPTPAQKLLFLARLPSILVTAYLGLILFLWTKKIFGKNAALVAALVFSFDPLIVANGALAMNDIFVTFFMFLSVLTCLNPERTGATWGRAGLFAGLAIGSKFSGFLVGPILLIIEIIQWRDNKAPLGKRVFQYGVFILIALLTLILLYTPHPTFFFDGLKEGLRFHKKPLAENTAGFLFVPLTGNSAWYYYPIGLLIKTPLSLLSLWFFSFWLLLKRSTNHRPFLILAVSPALVLLAAMMTRNHFGIRYLLPALPFLAILVGAATATLKTRLEKISWTGLLVWLIVECLWFHPHHMAYFNELVGGPSQGYRWLDGSNQDWGQDLPALSQFLKKNPGTVLLGYSGSGRPEAWGISYQDVFSPAITSAFRRDLPLPTDSKKEFLVLSAHLLRDPVYEWIGERKPWAVLGYTFFVFDITNDLDAVQHIADIYKASNRPILFNRQIERAKAIIPNERGTHQEVP